MEEEIMDGISEELEFPNAYLLECKGPWLISGHK